MVTRSQKTLKQPPPPPSAPPSPTYGQTHQNDSQITKVILTTEKYENSV